MECLHSDACTESYVSETNTEKAEGFEVRSFGRSIVSQVPLQKNGYEVKQLEYTSRRRRSYRIGIRIIGMIFTIGALAYLFHVMHTGVTGLRFITMAIAIVFLFVGVTYVRQSFGITAYDVTYKITPQQLELTTRNKNIAIPYDEVKDVSLSRVRPDMDYYMLHIITTKYNLIMHIEGQNEYAQTMYERLIEYTGICEETEKRVDSDSK